MASQGAYLYVPSEIDGLKLVVAKRNLNADEDDAGLAWFDFEAENSIAQMTGTLLWDASLAVVQLLKDPSHPLRSLIQGRRVLELGAGVGLAGLCCAAAGGHMMLSDLASIVDGILQRNISHNVTQVAAQLAAQQAGEPSTQQAASHNSSSQPQQSVQQQSGGAGPWHGAQPLGKGSVASMPVDFCKPLSQQVRGPHDPRSAEVVLAIDIVWLRELVAPLVATMADILTHAPHQPAPPPPDAQPSASQPATSATTEPSSQQQPQQRPAPKVGLLAFGERAREGSATSFVALGELCAAFEAAGCVPTLLGRVVVEREPGESMSVAVLQVTAAQP